MQKCMKQRVYNSAIWESNPQTDSIYTKSDLEINIQ